jgi:hypothetical protein
MSCIRLAVADSVELAQHNRRSAHLGLSPVHDSLLTDHNFTKRWGTADTLHICTV